MSFFAPRAISAALVVSLFLTWLDLRLKSGNTVPTEPSVASQDSGTAWDDAASSSAASDIVPAAATKFAYKIGHTALPLPRDVIARLSFRDDGLEPTDQVAELAELDKPLRRQPSRPELCSYAAAVARANDLPITFFANLIWQESTFNIKVVSRVGAQGIAQFMPATAVEFGLLNPFDPIHALSASGTFLRKLYRHFGNLGLAAAAYNAGPQRVRDWIANRGRLPEETRNYVLRITNRSAEDWLQMKASSKDILMPPSAPCAEVFESWREQWAAMRITETEFADAPIQLADMNPTAKLMRPQFQNSRESR